MYSRRRAHASIAPCWRRRALWLLALSALRGRHDAGNLAGRATDEWTHTYPLTAGGEVRIVNTNGKIEIEGVDGRHGRSPAERIARACDRRGGARARCRGS